MEAPTPTPQPREGGHGGRPVCQRSVQEAGCPQAAARRESTTTLAPYWRPIGALLAPIDANRAGYLKAVWPDLWGAFLRSRRPRGPGKAFNKMVTKGY